MGGITRQIGEALDNVPAYIDPFAGKLWDVVELSVKIDERVLEEVLGLFGIEDENVIQAEVSVQRVITDDVYATLLSRVALDHQAQPDTGVIEHLTVATSMIRDKYASFYEYGEDSYVNGLPDTSLKSYKVDSTTMVNAIEADLGLTNVVMLKSSRGVPLQEEYIAWYLTGTLGLNYQPWDESMVNPAFTYPTEVYTAGSINYIALSDTYDIIFNLVQQETTVTSDVTTITVTPLDAVEDTVTTELATLVEVTGSITGPISSVTTIVSTVVTTVPTGTVLDSTDIVEVSSVSTSANLDSEVISIPGYSPVVYYIGKYYTTNPLEYQYYLYSTLDNTHPEFTDSSVTVGQLDMLPIVELRNAGVSVTSNKSSAQYKQTEEILSTIGISVDAIMDSIEESPDIADVMDVFLHFAVAPSDSSAVVSKVLYNMLSFIYDDADLDGVATGLDGTAGSYTATFTEGTFNAVLLWSAQTRSVMVGSIGIPGTYNHSIVGDDLVVRRQFDATEYVEYRFEGMSSVTFVDRKGADDVGTVSSKLVEGDFVVPLSMFHVASLTPIEQSELFAKTLHLSVYAAQVTFVDWYKQPAFGDLIQVIAIVIVIVVTIKSWGTATKAGTSFYAWAVSTGINATVSLSISYALTKVFENTNNDLVRVLAAAAAIYAMTKGGSTSFAQTGVITADVLSQAVMIDIDIRQKDLRSKTSVFEDRLQDRQKELDAAAAELAPTALGTYDVLGLALLEPSIGYLDGIDAFMYNAKGQIQYQYDLLYDYDRQVGGMYDNVFRLDLNKALS